MIQEGLYYHKEHEWIRIEDKKATIGISDFAQEALGDIVYLEIPKVGETVKAGAEVTEIESTKTTSMLYAPISGVIVSVNESLEEQPEQINDDAYGQGWIVCIEMTDVGELDALMSAEAYTAFLENEAH